MRLSFWTLRPRHHRRTRDGPTLRDSLLCQRGRMAKRSSGGPVSADILPPPHQAVQIGTRNCVSNQPCPRHFIADLVLVVP